MYSLENKSLVANTSHELFLSSPQMNTGWTVSNDACVAVKRAHVAVNESSWWDAQANVQVSVSLTVFAEYFIVYELLHPSPCTPFLLKNMVLAGELLWLSSKLVKSVNSTLLWFRHPIHFSWTSEVNISAAVVQMKMDFQFRNTSFDKIAFLWGC